MIRQGFELSAAIAPWAGFQLQFWLLHYGANGERELATGFTFEGVNEGHTSPPPSFTLSDDNAQLLMDALWHAGIRPTQGRQSEGVTAAQARHLEDMRTIAFGKLNMPIPVLPADRR